MVSALAQMLPASLYRASAPGAAPAEPARPAEPGLAAALLANARETPLIAAPMEKKIKLYSPEFYTACTIGGILSCGLTHTAVTPLDVVKCNMQARPRPRARGAVAASERALRQAGRCRSTRSSTRASPRASSSPSGRPAPPACSAAGSPRCSATPCRALASLASTNTSKSAGRWPAQPPLP